MKQNLKYTIIVAVIFLMVIPVYAFQPGGPGGPGGPPPPPGLAIDGFLSIFLAIGAWVGVRSVKNKK